MNTQKIISSRTISLVLTGLFTLVFSIKGIAQNGVGVNTNTPKSHFEVNGSFGQKVTAITSTTTLDSSYNTIVCNNGATAISINLPTGVNSSCLGRIYTIKKGSASTATVTITAYSSETIEGMGTLVLTDAQEAVTLINNGTDWLVSSEKKSAFPMGEVSYFSLNGTNITITAQSNGTNNMVLCNPVSIFNSPSLEFSSNDSGRLIYTGKTTRCFHIACTISASPVTANDEFIFAVAKNDTIFDSSKIIQRFAGTTDSQSTAIHVAITMSTNDYLELYVGNLVGARNVILKTINLFALGM